MTKLFPCVCARVIINHLDMVRWTYRFMALFELEGRGRVFQQAGDVFAENNWTQVMLGQGLIPDQYHSIVDMMSDQELENFLLNLKQRTDSIVSQLPTHEEFIATYCKGAPN